MEVIAILTWVEMNAPTYVLITPARNEEAFLEKTIRSVVSQTILPKKWVLVSDGSTDGTDEIIQGYSSRHRWIHYLRRPEHTDRQFAAKAQCFAAGYDVVKNLPYDIIGNLDADVSFEPDYMEFLLEKFAQDLGLGVAGTPFIEHSAAPYDYRFTNIKHVSGACQLFRRECFEAVGGYKPIQGGGIDWLAVTTARMMGWGTKTFTEKQIFHHRRIGTGAGKRLGALFRQGRKDYSLGNHPAWEVFRVFYQMRYKPYGIGALTIFLGYATAFIRITERSAPPELIQFCRREQMQRLRAVFKLRKARRLDKRP